MDNTRERDTPAEEIHFGVTLACSIRWVLTAESTLSTIYLSKVKLADAYIFLWVRVEDTQYTAFIFPKCDSSDEHPVGFHFSLPMGSVDSTPYFFMETGTVMGMVNHSLPENQTPPPHPLEGDASNQAETDSGKPEPAHEWKWAQVPLAQQAAALAQVDVYLDNLVSACQGFCTERAQMVWHLL